MPFGQTLLDRDAQSATTTTLRKPTAANKKRALRKINDALRGNEKVKRELNKLKPKPKRKKT